MTWLLTHTGKHLDLVDPQPEMIDVIDIAKGLSRECRFAGQTKAFYSVAQHSIIASQMVDPEFAWEALLHDASEAYLKDIPRPLKLLLPDYRLIESRVRRAICARLDLPYEQSDRVTEIDLVMLATERRDLMPDDGTEWPCLQGVKPLPKHIQPINPNHAESLFLQRLLELALK